MHTIRPCAVDGCRSPVRSRYSPWCSGHRKALLRHGDAQQTSIKAHELRPFEVLIEKRQKANEGSQAWAILRGRWQAIVDQADAWIAEAERHSRWFDHNERAAKLVKEVAAHADPDKVIRTALAVAMHSQDNPRRYVSDKAYRYQLVRRVIKLAPISFGRAYDHKSRSVRAVWKDIPARTMDVLVELLHPAFSGAGAQFYAVEQRRRPPEEVERERLANALAALKA